jgi:hypothetical protein
MTRESLVQIFGAAIAVGSILVLILGVVETFF